jgi:hypothetical protein
METAKRHVSIKQIKDIYCPYCDCRNRIVCHDPNKIRSHLIRRGFMDNYVVWDHHGERSIEARAIHAPKVHGVDNAMHDNVIREDFDGGGGGGGDDGCDDGEGYGGEDDDGEDNNEEEEDFLEDMLLNMEKELLLKGLKNLEGVKKARKERLYPEEQGCEKRWSLLHFFARLTDFEG